MKSDELTKYYFLILLVIIYKCYTIRIVNVCKATDLSHRRKYYLYSPTPNGRLKSAKYKSYDNSTEDNCIGLCCSDSKCNFSLFSEELNSCYVYQCNYRKFKSCLPITTRQKSNRSSVLYLLRFPKYFKKHGISRVLSVETQTNATGSLLTTTSTSSTSKVVSPIIRTPLKVEIGENKTIHLPENSVTLIATVYDNSSSKYEYEWELVSKPTTPNAGTLDGKNNRELKLSNLILGEYQFKVAVHGNNSFGEAFVYVFVKPAIKKNEPPVAIIKPKHQIVQLPNNIILDGSGSTDDEKIVSYHWETVQGPIEMEKNLKDDQPMLQLDKNVVPGNYSFKLTVKDAEGKSSSTTAYLTVLPEKDYPPKADPGPNMIVTLPTNSVVLNGSGSTDDKKIVSYEWTKKADTLTADIQGVREPILKLSNLQVGTYSFNLKVTDSAGQSSDKDVNVFVKPHVNVPPTAKASVTEDKTIIVRLPANEAQLNGSMSYDDGKIVKYQWKQVGENKLNLVDADKPIASVNDLKVGVFSFNLTVWDDEGKSSSDTVVLRVNENENQKPKAIILENPTFYYLQPNLVTINGSKSWDDHKIAKYQWQREDDSLAVGDILEKSDSESVLLLTGLLPGKYKFKLTVSDDEGVSDSVISTFIVLPSRLQEYFVELQFLCDAVTFTESRKNDFINNIQSIIQKKVDSDSRRVKINVVKMESVPFINSILIVFYATLEHKSLLSDTKGTKESSTVTDLQAQNNVQSQVNINEIQKTTNLSALKVLEALNEVRHDLSVLTYPLIRIETYVCQNNCSGHGSCHSITKLCICDTFWTSNILRDRFGDGRPNCDWSIIYLVIFFSFIFLVFFGFIWFMIWFRKRKCKSKKMPKNRKYKYIKLKEYDDKMKLDGLAKFPKSLTNGIKSRSNPDKENHNFVDSDSNLSSEAENTMFLNSRNGVSASSLSTATPNGQTMRNL